LILCLILATIPITIVAAAAPSVGVNTGEWIRWNITVASQGQSATMWLQVTIKNVSITTSQVDATYESNLPGLPSDPTDFSVNVATGRQNTLIYSAIDRLMIVSANLNPNDPLPGNPLIVNGTATKNGRDAAVVTLLTPNDGMSTYYWDRVKGVLLEFSSSSGNTTTLIQVADTSMWGTGLVNWSLWISVAIVVVVVAVAAYMVVRWRRSRRSE
jgi:hypothetical protein